MIINIDRKAKSLKNFLASCLCFLAFVGQAHLSRSETVADVEAFVDANLQHILQHEIGHALIELLALPVLAQEEDAADLYATMDVLENFEEADARNILTYAVIANLKMAEQAGTPDVEDYYGEHDLDIQRAYRIVCLGFGSDEDAFMKMADRFAMPEERRDSCIDDADRAWDSWGQVLAPHLRGEDEPVGTSVIVEYAEDEDFADIRDYMMSMRLLEEAADYLNKQFHVSPLTLKAETCGEPNAFFDPDDRTVSVCFELYDWLAEMAENAQ